MEVPSKVRRMGSGARRRAELVGHRVRDRRAQTRMDGMSEDNERLRTENRMLREEVEESRRERLRILDLIEEALSNRGSENGTHRGRGLLLLLILGSGAYAAIRMAKTAGF